MFGSLPKLLDKNFVIGFFLPALLAVYGTAWAFPNLSILDPIRNLSATGKTLNDFVYLGLIVGVLAILMMTGNHLLYRLLEGYLPPFSWLILGLWRHRRRFDRLTTRYDNLMATWQSAVDNEQEFPVNMLDQISRLRRRLVTYYPNTKQNIMPTRFGNAIRAFEVYPTVVYGVDSVPVWLRLASVISKDYIALLEDARAQSDCFVNITFIALAIGLASLGAAGYDADWRMMPHRNALTLSGILIPFGLASMRHAAVAAASALSAAITYWWATERAIAWGDLVKSAFDAYLPALIKQLGFSVPPTDAQRRKFWTEFSALITYEHLMSTDRWPLAVEVRTAKEDVKSDKEIP